MSCPLQQEKEKQWRVALRVHHNAEGPKVGGDEAEEEEDDAVDDAEM